MRDHAVKAKSEVFYVGINADSPMMLGCFIHGFDAEP